MRFIKVNVCTACGPPDGVRQNPAKLGEGLQQLCLARPVVQLQITQEADKTEAYAIWDQTRASEYPEAACHQEQRRNNVCRRTHGMQPSSVLNAVFVVY